MITRQDILDRAAAWKLAPQVVEKDYVLGWLLAAIAQHKTAGRQWVFKGGTCLKKCYFETYRFSEDIDFTLRPEASYTQRELLVIITEICASAAVMSGIGFPKDGIEVRAGSNLRGNPTFQGRLSYNGPIAPRGSLPRIIIDITNDEIVVREAARLKIIHPYPDELPINAAILCYTFEELFAEKTRALLERARPRDLYDVVYVAENRPVELDYGIVREVYAQKLKFKGLDYTSAAMLASRVRDDAELVSEWENMLGHQLPGLPGLSGMLTRLEPLLSWVDGKSLTVADTNAGLEAVVDGVPPILSPYIQFQGSNSPLELIRFAGANRQLISFMYSGKNRVAEVYSFRNGTQGNVLLYAWEHGDKHIKAFDLDKMTNVEVQGGTYSPRYTIELSSRPQVVRPATIRATTTARHRPPRSHSRGPNYIYECPICGKKFRRKERNSRLRPHKMKNGYVNCPGTTAHLVDTTY